MKKNRLKYLFILICSVLFFGSCSFGTGKTNGHIRDAEILVSDVDEAARTTEIRQNTYTDLSIPTQITRVGDTYFIVDCYHDQVIYNDDLDTPVSGWKVMTDEMSRGHTLASDGTVYMLDDTENERIMVFERSGGEDGRFVFSQQFPDIGGRPHYIIYDEKSESFFAWCSVSGQMYIIKHDEEGPAYISEIRSVPELDGIYVRSFTLTDDCIYFVSGNSRIIKADRDTFEVLERYPVPDEMAGMVQISLIDGMYYITVSTDASWDQDYATIVRCASLEGLSENRYEDVYDAFIGGGTPYYITSFDGAYYMTEHRLPGHSIWRFEVENGKINAETVY